MHKTLFACNTMCW